MIKHVVSDIDGVFGLRGRFLHPGQNTIEDFSRLLKTWEELERDLDVDLTVITDRGAEQLRSLAEMFPTRRYQIAESGGAAYDTFTNGFIINPKFEDHFRKVSRLKLEFWEKFHGKFHLEAGVLTSLRVERINNQDLSEAWEYLSDFVNDNSDFELKDHGDVVSLKPKGITKKDGYEFLVKLDTEIETSKVLWMADGDSDISVAVEVHQRGGLVAAVNNCHPNYREYVQENGGYISKFEHAKGAIEILEYFWIDQMLKKERHLKTAKT